MTHPIACLIQRLIDVVLFIIAVGCLVLALFIGVFIDHPEGKVVIGLGMVAATIGAFLDFRQKTIYSSNNLEASLLSGGLNVKYLNSMATLRNKLVAANITIVVIAMWVSGYGAVWGKF